ncbi:palmitoyl-acyl carrier protein thioesterase [Spatholobus suberectus]|nr:palmitoyl-acyl carrier protein thioesterase [Spatholobus suberectus]
MTNDFQSTVSEITFERNKEVSLEETRELPTVSEVDNAKCECCGMCEECTHEYIKRVRDMFSGKLICGLCAEAVNVEMEKNGGKREEALKEHMSDCVKFNRLGRSHPALYQAEDVKKILKKTLSRAMSTSPTGFKGSQSEIGTGGTQGR